MENLSPSGGISEEYWIQALPLIFAELCDECGGLTVTLVGQMFAFEKWQRRGT